MNSDLLQNPYFQVFLILIISFIAAKVIKEIIIKGITNFTSKTKSELDDHLIDIIGRPLYIIVVVIGIHISVNRFGTLNGYADLVNQAFFLTYTFIAAYSLSGTTSALINQWLKVKKQFESTPKMISKLGNVVVWFVAVLFVLNHFDIEIGPLVAALGLGGLAIGLALQDTLANFFAGIHLISDEPVRVGEYVEIGSDVAGTVKDIGWRSTKLRTLGNNIIIIPNSKLAGATIKNLSLFDKQTSAGVSIGVDYNSDLEKVEKTLLEVGTWIQENTEGAVKGHKPTVRFTNFGDSSINVSIYMRASSKMSKMKIQHTFIKEIKTKFDKEKIEFAWPTMKIISVK